LRRTNIIFLLLLALLVCVSALSLLAGPADIPLSALATSGVLRLRLARVILAIVAGAGLSVAGVVFQAILRNPLADPYVLGVSSGAGLGAAVAIMTGLTVIGPWLLPAAAFVGAFVTILLVYVLAGVRGAVPTHTLLLAGVVVGTGLSSVLTFLVSVSSYERLHSVMWWLMGNLQIFDWKLLWLVGGVVVCGTLLTFLFSRNLNVIMLGEEPAAHLGLKVETTKKLFFIVGSLITGAIVCACGLVGFVGLIVPHSVRLVAGAEHKRLVVGSAVAGAIFLVVADALARSVLAPREVPIGVLTAFVGCPFFIYLLRKRKKVL
jgi:iron complex transport system permease protein